MCRLVITKKTIDECNECPHALLRPFDCKCCVEHREIPNSSSIPHWCPLPEGGEGESEYKRGFKDATRQWAWWKDGKQLVGTRGRSLQDVLDNIEEEPYYQE